MHSEKDETNHSDQSDRRVYRINDLPAEIREAIRASKMDSSHDYLDEALQDSDADRVIDNAEVRRRFGLTD